MKIIEERDNMAFQIVNDFPHIEYEHAYQLLQDENWDLEQVKTELDDAKMIKLEQEQDEDTAIIQVLEECPEVLDIEDIRQKLNSCNLNANTVIQQYMDDANKVSLLLCDCSDMSV